MNPLTRRELSPWGLQGRAAEFFVASQLDSRAIHGADLVLTADRRHRAAVVELVPGALVTAFSLREFARLLSSADLTGLPSKPVARAHSLVDVVRETRGLMPRAAPSDDTLPDPIGRSQEVHHSTAVLISAAVRVLVDAITAPGVR
jgi:protein-tyrosine phosphatase